MAIRFGGPASRTYFVMKACTLLDVPRNILGLIALNIVAVVWLAVRHVFNIQLLLVIFAYNLLLPFLLSVITARSKARMLRVAPAMGGVADLRDVEEKAISLQARQRLLDNVRVKYGVPAIAGACVIYGQPRTASVAGVRRAFTQDWLQKDDRFHLGSCTKSMTATMLARLVEAGVLDWQMTVADAFPELVGTMRKPYQDATLEQLLSHRSGMNGNWTSWSKYLALYGLCGTEREQRYEHLKMILSYPPVSKPGARYYYTNAGYCVAACIAEKMTEQPWEDLMRTLVFEPLGMTSAGFGTPGGKDDKEHPWGHLPYHLRPVEPGPFADVPLVEAPAASVHCSMEDLVRFVALHTRGAYGESGLLLKSETFAFLHKERANSKYALGWHSCRDKQGNERVWHSGSIRLWHTETFIWPRNNAAVVVATNTAGPSAKAACRAAVKALVLPVTPLG